MDLVKIFMEFFKLILKLITCIIKKTSTKNQDQAKMVPLWTPNIDPDPNSWSQI